LDLFDLNNACQGAQGPAGFSSMENQFTTHCPGDSPRAAFLRQHEVEVVKDPSVLQALQPDWDSLYQRADRPYLSNSFEWVWCAWESLAKPRGGRLHCIAVREGSRVVLIWPLFILRRYRFWKAVLPLNMSLDYTDVLVEASPHAGSLAELAWRTLRKTADADLILAERVRTDSLLHQLLLTEKANHTYTQRVLYVSWEGIETWDAYHARLSPRRELNRRLRRLSECGEVAFEIIEDPDRQREMIDWLLRRKEKWVAEKRLRPVWGDEPHREFLVAVSRRVSRFGKLLTFVLTLDHEPIAVQTWSVDAYRMVSLQITHEPKWSKCSPGNLLLRHILQWAFERQLLADFNRGVELTWKTDFGNQGVEILSRRYAISGWGYIGTELYLCSALLRERLSTCLALLRRKRATGSVNHSQV
jgi:CelD/BcsL family acetyltransferase involved in cellulose biosynthesis